jgi:DnaJ-class molecular chaperone
VRVKLAASLLGVGGLVTVEYDRDVRADDGRSLVRIRELHDLRVPPDVRDGDTLRVEKLGHAGPGGGPYGDLVATVEIVGVGPRMRMPKADAPAAGEVIVVDVPFTDAILGGRVEVPTPQGRLRVAIPAGTSSGARFRLKGRGKPDATGQPGDLFAEVRVTVPGELDEESRRLIEKFAELNPAVSSPD